VYNDDVKTLHRQKLAETYFCRTSLNRGLNWRWQKLAKPDHYMQWLTKKRLMTHETQTSGVVYRQLIVIIVACTSTWLISRAVGLSQWLISRAVGLSQWLIVSETNTSTVVHIHTITSANKVMSLPRLVCWSPVSQQDYSSYSNRKCKKLPFSRTTAHIFVSPGDSPATITQYVAWMEKQFNACQTPHSMCLSIFNSFRVIRCLNKCVSPKIYIFITFLFPLGHKISGVSWVVVIHNT